MLHDCNLCQWVVGLSVLTRNLTSKHLVSFSRIPLLGLLFCTFLLNSIEVLSQQNNEQTSIVGSEYEGLSDAELLEMAEYFEDSDVNLSQQLAIKALNKSIENNDPILSAKTHRFLGNFAENANDFELAASHFLKGSLIYKEEEHQENFIKMSLYYTKTLLKQKLYTEAVDVITELLPIALEYGDEPLIGRSLILQGDGLYKSKRYEDAIAAYSEATAYLTGHDEVIQKFLGNTYKQLAQSYKRLKNREKTALYYKKTLDVYTALRDQRLIARTLNTLAEAERYLGHYVIALEYSIRGIELHKLLDDPEGRAKALTGAGIIYRYIGRYQKSLKHIHEAHLYYKKVGDNSGLAKTSNQMGLIYTRLKQFAQARSFYQLTVDLPRAEIDANTLSTAFRELAVIDLNNGDYETALTMAEKALNTYQAENDRSKQALALRIIGNIYRDAGDQARSIHFYRQSLSTASEIGNKIYEAKAKTALAGVLIGENTDEAISLLIEAVATSEEINNKPQMLYAYRLLIKAEKVKGNIASALDYAEKEIALSLLIQEENESNELVLQKASLYSHKMEIELESLREKAKLDKLELERKNNEIEIAGQAQKISELELVKNQYASIALVALLIVCLFIVLAIYRRFNDSKKRNRELDYLAARDPLTNCYNRRVLFELMSRDFASLEPLNEYCVIMIDIDHFKRVNDTYGHSIGDEVIRGVGDLLQNAVRQNDIVARYGGEEFCVVLPSASQHQAMRISETIRSQIEIRRFENIAITASLGVSSIKFKAKSPSELINQADVALFRSKSLGRNQVTFWDESLTE
ncbi:MAG: tetratricopeptide repeat-containing diguanylate cyclase [Paraglaciecola sp.]|uniref:tetratricopeptide repeat-containing diguanylate cyclase n=1 Tax=Paraglaciecola sp. TaxID=1920173 RepID=UPI003262EC13